MQSKKKAASQVRAILVVVLSFITLSVAFSYVQDARDWRDYFRPATLEMLAGHDPYSVNGFFNAPWTLILVVPLALLPTHAGQGILIAASLLGWLLAAHRMKYSRVATLALLASPPVLLGLWFANIDWLPVLGIVLPPAIGLFLVMIKPQVGAGIALYWLVEAWRAGGSRRVVVTFAPISIAFLLSFLIFGLWPLKASAATAYSWNISLFPLLMPAGFVLLIRAIDKRSILYALPSGLCFSPYVAFSSASVALFALAPAEKELLVAVLGTWAIAFFAH